MDVVALAAEKAGIERATLFDNNAARRGIRAPDLRATFIMIALAIGRSERWVADRTELGTRRDPAESA